MDADQEKRVYLDQPNGGDDVMQMQLYFLGMMLDKEGRANNCVLFARQQQHLQKSATIN